jgi:S-adenosylmethionine-diacylgycerolhomoserine-N-methlytransferase
MTNDPVASGSPADAATGHEPPNKEQAVAMDRMYRFTRHIYDITRAYYLLGRDRMLSQVQTGPGTATVEVGCGTARNLIKLARRPQPGLLCGLDASQEMLDTAAASIARAKVPAAGNEPIRLKQGLAEDLDAAAMFGRTEPFDTVFFSYCLSMVPTWPAAIEAALANLKPGGKLLIVDFWDQADLPRLFAAGLKKWLALFHVHYRPEVHDALVTLGQSGRADVAFESVYRRYAYIATVTKR